MALSRIGLPPLRRVEIAVIVYALLAGLVAAVRTAQFAHAWYAVAAQLLIVLLVLLTAATAPAHGTRRLPQRLRDALPLLLLPALYPLLDIVNLAGGVPTWDALAQRAEAALFGGQPSRDWWRVSPSVFWSTLLHAAYLSYYALVALPAAYIVLRGTSAERDMVITRIVVCFLCCYAAFVLVPVAGPYYQFDRPSGAFIENLPAQWVYASLHGGSSFGAAFPSSHVAATLTATLVMLRVRPRVGILMVIPALLLCVSVVYCAMHYAVDAIAGAVVGAVVGLWPRRQHGHAPA